MSLKSCLTTRRGTPPSKLTSALCGAAWGMKLDKLMTCDTKYNRFFHDKIWSMCDKSVKAACAFYPDPCVQRTWHFCWYRLKISHLMTFSFKLLIVPLWWFIIFALLTPACLRTVLNQTFQICPGERPRCSRLLFNMCILNHHGFYYGGP